MRRVVVHFLLVAMVVLFAPPTASQAANTAVLSGSVSSTAGGALPGASVTAYDAGTGKAVRSAKTIADGSYRIGSLPAGSYKLRALLTGYLTSYNGGAATLALAAPFDLAAGQETATGLSLVPEAVLSGSVSSTAGGPLPGASVTAYDAGTGKAVRSAKTIADGSYRIGSLPAGSYKLRALLTGYLTAYNAGAASLAAAPAIPLDPGQSVTTDTALRPKVVVDTTPPGPVTEVQVTGSGTDFISLAWTNPADPDLARIIVRRAEGTTPPPPSTTAQP